MIHADNERLARENSKRMGNLMYQFCMECIVNSIVSELTPVSTYVHMIGTLLKIDRHRCTKWDGLSVLTSTSYIVQ